MTRNDILKNYDVNENGVITSPGKFERQMVYVPHFWEAGLDGNADYDNGKAYAFEILNKDVAEFPELEGENTIILRESEMGFVTASFEQSLAIVERELGTEESEYYDEFSDEIEEEEEEEEK